MDPNNNQPMNTNPLGQAAGFQSGSPAPSIAVPPAQTEVPAPETPAVAPTPPPAGGTVLVSSPNLKGKGKKVITLLIILLILAIGMGGYIFFTKNQLNKKQKTASENTSTIIPTATIVPTVTPGSVDEIDVASPDADLNAIEQDLQGL